MLRVASNRLSKRALLSSSRGFPVAPSQAAFHGSVRREEESKEIKPVEPAGGFLGTGVSEWYALPVGIIAALPVIKFEWYVINEETQLLAVFITFCIALYTQAGDAIYKSLDETAQTILKEHTEAEDKVIEALEQKLEFLKANSNLVNDFEAINKMRESAYVNLNAAGKIKPKHDFKAQVERTIAMIIQEEQNVAEKAKASLMEEATMSVTAKFQESKQLKKDALDAAISVIKGSAKPGQDPVQAAFVDFFKAKGAAASKADDGSEAKAQREALVSKVNSLAKNEGFFFQLDTAGNAKMLS